MAIYMMREAIPITITFNTLWNTVVVVTNQDWIATVRYGTTQANKCTSTNTNVATVSLVSWTNNTIKITALSAWTCSIYEWSFLVCTLTVTGDLVILTYEQLSAL